MVVYGFALSETRQPRQPGIVAIILLILAGKHGRVISRDQNQSPSDPHIGQGYQHIGGNIDADSFMAHKARSPQAAAPAAHSRATFSLTEYSKYSPVSWAI